MSRQAWDKSSKWLVQHQGRGILYLAGVRNVRRCRALQAELVQPAKLPDGLLEVFFRDSTQPDHVLLEIATYPERRAVAQALDDLMLAYQHLRKLPELLILVLRPKGRYRIPDNHTLTSQLGWSELAGRWKVVELWNLRAEELLAANEVGLIPWVPLTQYAGPPEKLLEECRERIERQAPEKDRANLLAVSQILVKLRYNDPLLLSLLGGKQVMIDSPLVKELMAEKLQNTILRILQRRFGEVPLDVTKRLAKVQKEKRLDELVDVAVVCADLAAFQRLLKA